jgi:hypothetical protein
MLFFFGSNFRVLLSSQCHYADLASILYSPAFFVGTDGADGADD